MNTTNIKLNALKKYELKSMKQNKIALNKSKKHARKAKQNFLKNVPDEQKDAVESVFSEYNFDSFVNMTDDELLELDNKLIQAGFRLDVNGMSPEKIKEYKIDVYRFLALSINMDSDMEKADNEIDRAIMDYDISTKKILDDYSANIHKLTADAIRNSDIINSDAYKQLQDTININIRKAITLEDVISESKKLKNPKNTLDEFNNYRSIEVYKQYKQILNELNIKGDLSYIKDVETNCLDKKYHDYNNLAIYILMKYIAKRKSSVTFSKKNDGVFATYIFINLHKLISNENFDNDDKDIFINSLERLLDIFIG